MFGALSSSILSLLCLQRATFCWSSCRTTANSCRTFIIWAIFSSLTWLVFYFQPEHHFSFFMLCSLLHNPLFIEIHHLRRDLCNLKKLCKAAGEEKQSLKNPMTVCWAEWPTYSLSLWHPFCTLPSTTHAETSCRSLKPTTAINGNLPLKNPARQRLRRSSEINAQCKSIAHSSNGKSQRWVWDPPHAPWTPSPPALIKANLITISPLIFAIINHSLQSDQVLPALKPI